MSQPVRERGHKKLKKLQKKFEHSVSVIPPEQAAKHLHFRGKMLGLSTYGGVSLASVHQQAITTYDSMSSLLI